MTADAQKLAETHRRCFSDTRNWSIAEFSALLAEPGSICIATETGFALGRTILDETELLVICVDPQHRRSGNARAMLIDYLEAALGAGALRCFLEVGCENDSAIGLYSNLGFTEVGRRRNYYRTSVGAQIDAIVMAKALA